MSDQPRPTPSVPLSQRVRPDCEVAGYVHREILNLERESDARAERIAELEKELRNLRAATVDDTETVYHENAKLREACKRILPDWIEDELEWATQNPKAPACEITYEDLIVIRQALAGKDSSEPTA